jgi:hypothetical protein
MSRRQRLRGALSTDHAESLLDESIEATFPASDPQSSVQPGSVVNLAYEAMRRPRGVRTPWLSARAWGWILAGAALAIGVSVLARRAARRPRR